MDVLEIRYETGHMTINVPMYFPCLQKHARKLFPLIKQYCTGEDRAALAIDTRNGPDPDTDTSYTRKKFLLPMRRTIWYDPLVMRDPIE